MLFVGSTLWVADRKGVYRVTRGKSSWCIPPRAFPAHFTFSMTSLPGSGGSLYVSDTGDSTAAGHGAVFRLAPGKEPTVVAGSDTVRAQSSVNGLFTGRR